MTQIPGARLSTSAYQGHNVDEPEAYATAIRRSHVAAITGQLVLKVFSLTGTGGGSNPPPRSSQVPGRLVALPSADHSGKSPLVSASEILPRTSNRGKATSPTAGSSKGCAMSPPAARYRPVMQLAPRGQGELEA